MPFSVKNAACFISERVKLRKQSKSRGALFSIITRGRTGSTALASDLDSHPNITRHQELLRRDLAPQWGDRVPTLGAFLEQDVSANFDKYLDLLLDRKEVGSSAVGMKILLNQVSENESVARWRR